MGCAIAAAVPTLDACQKTCAAIAANRSCEYHFGDLTFNVCEVCPDKNEAVAGECAAGCSIAHMNLTTTMWTAGGCRGVFDCDGVEGVVCQSVGDHRNPTECPCVTSPTAAPTKPTPAPTHWPTFPPGSDIVFPEQIHLSLTGTAGEMVVDWVSSCPPGAGSYVTWNDLAPRGNHSDSSNGTAAGVDHASAADMGAFGQQISRITSSLAPLLLAREYSPLRSLCALV